MVTGVNSGHSGAGWLRGQRRWIPGSRKEKTKGRYEEIQPGKLGSLVADILGFVYRGLYHIDQKAIQKVEWENERFISILIYGDLATWDRNDLTELVILCHMCSVRLSVSALNRRNVELMFHPRVPDQEAGVSRRHPSIEEALASLHWLVELVEEAA